MGLEEAERCLRQVRALYPRQYLTEGDADDIVLAWSNTFIDYSEDEFMTAINKLLRSGKKVNFPSADDILDFLEPKSNTFLPAHAIQAETRRLDKLLWEQEERILANGGEVWDSATGSWVRRHTQNLIPQARIGG